MSANTANSGVIDRDGFLLRYKIEGEGLPAIIIGSVDQYTQTFSTELRQHLKMVFIDHRAFVPVPAGLENVIFELDTILDDIEKIRQALSLDQIIIIGHSGHSYMALEYAKKYSSHVSHVVMIAISPSLSLKSQQEATFYWQDFASNKRKAAHTAHLQQTPDETLASLMPYQRYIKEYIRNSAKFWYDSEMDASFMWRNAFLNMPLFNHIWFTVFRDIDITKDLEFFNTPVFLALGLYDFAIAPFTAWYPIREQFKHLDLFLFKKSGHTPQFEEPELFNERLLAWLQQNP